MCLGLLILVMLLCGVLSVKLVMVVVMLFDVIGWKCVVVNWIVLFCVLVCVIVLMNLKNCVECMIVYGMFVLWIRFFWMILLWKYVFCCSWFVLIIDSVM